MSETVLNELLEAMSDKYDKRPGHLVHDFLTPIANALQTRDSGINFFKMDGSHIMKG